MDLNELLEDLRDITPTMTEEKYNYLKNDVNISPLKKLKLRKLKKYGANNELLTRLEYSYLFEVYQNSWLKSWQKLDWGMRENEGLAAFADSALEQAVAELNENKSSVRRR